MRGNFGLGGVTGLGGGAGRIPLLKEDTTVAEMLKNAGYTTGMVGYGRSDKPTQWGGSVFLQIIDPEAFSGLDYFKKEMDLLVNACLSVEPREANSPVRLPGSRALALRKEQLENGVQLYPTIAPALEECALKYALEVPAAIEI